MKAMPDLCYMRQPVNGQALRLIDDLMIGRREIARLPVVIEIVYRGPEALQEAGILYFLHVALQVFNVPAA
jgi:hypothetical protein